MVGKYFNIIDFVHTKGNGLPIDQTVFKSMVNHLISISAFTNFKISSKRSLSLNNQIFFIKCISRVMIFLDIKSNSSDRKKINAIPTSIFQNFF